MAAESDGWSRSEKVRRTIMSRYHYELATRADDLVLRSILRNTPMPGEISIAFTREPSYFDAAVVDGRFRQVVVARETESCQIVGFGSRSVAPRFVNGQPSSVGYLSSLRVLPEHRKRTVIAGGYSFFHQLHQDRRTPIYLTTIAHDNAIAQNALARGRAGLPTYHPVGSFHTAAIPLTRRRRSIPIGGSFEIRPADRSDLPEIIRFLNVVGSKRQLFPCYELDDFSSSTGPLRGLRIQDILLAIREGRIAGTLAGWDQYAFRQNVVSSYDQPLRSLRPLYNAYARLRGVPEFPRPGAAIRCLMGALPVVEMDDGAVFRGLIEELCIRKSGGRWDYLMVGMHDSDPLLPVLRLLPARWYTTSVYVACWDDGESIFQSIDDRPLYLELGSL